MVMTTSEDFLVLKEGDQIVVVANPNNHGCWREGGVHTVVKCENLGDNEFGVHCNCSKPLSFRLWTDYRYVRFEHLNKRGPW